MRILIDIGHPAHVHLFKHFAWEMQKNGHNILFTCREKEFEIELLKVYGFDYVSFGTKYQSKIGKIWGLIKFDIKEFITSIKFKPDIFLSHGSIYAAHVSYLKRKPHIALEDTGNMEQVRLYLPFSNTVLVPEMFHKDLGKKQLRYKGIHELFYLHPKYFKPDERVLAELELNKNEEFIILRLISWNASHDKQKANKSKLPAIIKIVEIIKSMNIRIFISSEANLPDELKIYQMKINPFRLHDALAFAKLYIGEGGTTATEASILGTPSIIINEQAKKIGIHQKLQNEYELQYFFDNIDDASEKIFNLLKVKNIKELWRLKRDKFINENINPTEFLLDYILNKKWEKKNDKNN
ncbi:MAG: DUF354 domain-containing protein [Bacteroidales bacterium]|nr:DUF354 domain-containing protein [Bacteroidales bacterium]